MAAGRLEEQPPPLPPEIVGVGGRNDRGLRNGGVEKRHLVLRQPPAPQAVRVGQERQVALVGQQGMDPGIWRHHHRPRQVGGPQHRVSRLVEGEVDKPIIDQIDGLAADRQGAAAGHGQVVRVGDDRSEPPRLQ